ncbi:CpaD family pilus assembly protein [Hyphomicrobium sp. CS1GBMeth3]|uniref:CpaD family pilus assembly protein n=1 Tax=Hyphomicrobium sp. CS1GBMeth3 TaxID=1892845 RepID=UPI0009311385|nr:CpaD family pilus assembly protein [Hyphomicrobium sp. CS1GBMeth3]
MKYEIASRPASNAQRTRRAAPIALALLAAAAAAGCRNDPTAPQVAGWSMIDPSQRHPIIVSQQPQTMQIRIPAGSRGLSPRQRADVLEFADRSRAVDAGNSRLVIQAPGGGANEIAAMNAVGEIRQILGDMGFADSSIAVEAYHTDGHSDAPVRVTYLRYVAEAPVCGYWPTNLANQRDNTNYPNFGCANQHNLAVSVANPADLIGPRTESDRPSERRDVVWDHYRNGKSTGSEKSEDEKVRIAK